MAALPGSTVSVDVDLLFTAPFVIDVIGNALGLYDSIEWWDDANHFFNWMLITAGAALVIRSTGSRRLICFGLAVGFAAVSAIAWELAEYVTFVRFSSELATAYADTLGDLALGTLGGALGAAIVGLRSPGRAALGRRAVPTSETDPIDTQFCRLVGIPLPIVQAPIGGMAVPSSRRP